MATTNIPVRVDSCLCPGAPHEDGDSVYLRPKLGLASGTVVQSLLVQASGGNVAEVTGQLAEAYLLHGVAEWTLVDDKGKPVPVNADTIREHLLDDFTVASPIANAADDLYTPAVLDPLLKRAAESSNGSSTTKSTSVTPPGQPTAAKQSRRSSTSTTRTGDTVATSA